MKQDNPLLGFLRVVPEQEYGTFGKEWFFAGVVWIIPSNAQRLLLALHLEIIPGALREPYGILEIKPLLTTCKARTLLTVLYIWLQEWLLLKRKVKNFDSS